MAANILKKTMLFIILTKSYKNRRLFIKPIQNAIISLFDIHKENNMLVSKLEIEKFILKIFYL